MVRAAYIEDDSRRLVFLSERAHGVASLSQGQLEVRARICHSHLLGTVCQSLRPFLSVYYLKVPFAFCAFYVRVSGYAS